MLNRQPFITSLADLKKSGRYRVFNDILRENGQFPRARWYSPHGIKNIVNWCSNDYLGMGQNKVVTDAMHAALDLSGAGAGGTRNISGTSHLHIVLEQELADLHRQEAALLFSSAYVANEWTLIALGQIIPSVHFVSDADNHNSLIVGIKHSRRPKTVFKHNDLTDLEHILRQIKAQGETPCIVFESVYSMTGDVGKIKEICALADKYQAVTYLDEVHAVGLYGNEGAGKLEELNLQSEVDIVNGTLGKAFGVQGGYIAAPAVVIDAVRSTAAGFIFTTSLSPVTCAGALAAVQYLRRRPQLRYRHQQTAALLKSKLEEAGVKVMPAANSHIVPVLIGDAARTKTVSDNLLSEYGIYAQAINYPTVPQGTERLRLTPTPYHTPAMITQLVTALSKLLQADKPAAAL